jgi:hypothetical protein
MKFIKNNLKNKLFESLKTKGFHVQRMSSQQWGAYEEYHRQAELICQRHSQQTQETVKALRQKYKQPVFGKIRVWSLIEMLGQCVDPGDRTLYCTSQLTHVLQMIEEMEKDGISSPDFYIAALIHDLGKVLLLTGEAPENVVGGHHQPIGEYEEGIGLDNCILQWDHGEFIYSRLQDYLPEHLAWLVRYHAMIPKKCEAFMNEQDRAYTKKCFETFYKYDSRTKSPYFLPKIKLEKYRDLIEENFPEPILF